MYLFIDLQRVICFSRKYLLLAMEEGKICTSFLQLVSLRSFYGFEVAEVA